MFLSYFCFTEGVLVLYFQCCIHAPCIAHGTCAVTWPPANLRTSVIHFAQVFKRANITQIPEKFGRSCFLAAGHGGWNFLSTHRNINESEWEELPLVCVFDGPASCLLVSTASSRRLQGEYLINENFFCFCFICILAAAEDYWSVLSSAIAWAFHFLLLWSSGPAEIAQLSWAMSFHTTKESGKVQLLWAVPLPKCVFLRPFWGNLP